MSALLITYDLNEETKRPPIVKKIKTLGTSWAKLSESSYAIATSKTSSAIYKSLEDMIDENDRLYVIPLKKPYAGFGLKKVNQWLDQNLP